MNNCCFTDHLAKCETEIQVYAMLTPTTAYRWVITDKFGNKYEGEVTTDADGFFAIPVEDLPAGMLTQYSGSFLLQVYLQDTTCAPEKFKIAAVHDCIEFTVTGGTFEKNNLGCDFSCTASPTGSALIPFTDAATVPIDWTAYDSLYGNNPTIQVYHETSPGVYQLVAVSIEQVRVDGTLTEININNGGAQTGYVIIS